VWLAMLVARAAGQQRQAPPTATAAGSYDGATEARCTEAVKE